MTAKDARALIAILDAGQCQHVRSPVFSLSLGGLVTQLCPACTLALKRLLEPEANA